MESAGQKTLNHAEGSASLPLTSILDGISDAVYVLDLEWRFTYVNAQAGLMTGLSKEELLGKRVWDILPATVGTSFETEARRAVAEQRPASIEYFHPAFGRWYEHRFHPAPQGLLLFTTDIDERKRLAVQPREAEDAVRTGENRFRRIFETAGVAIFEEDFSALTRKLRTLREQGIVDLARYLEENPKFVEESVGLVSIRDVNRASLRLFGAEEKAQLLESLHCLFLPETLSVFKEELLAIWEGRKSVQAETVLRTLAGELRHVLFSLERPEEDPQLSSVLVSLMDITPLKEAEALVRASEERQRRAVEAGKVGLWEWDIVENRVTWSDYIYELYGLAPGKFEGTVEHFARLVHPLDQPAISEALRNALAGHGDYSIEFRPLRPDGQTRWLATSGRVTFDETGRPVQMHGAVLDTTERREAEEALRRTNAELEEFAYVASHDLQEPLRAVNIYSQLLLKQCGVERDEQAVEFADFVRGGVKRMELLIKDLLAYSRVIHHEQEAGQSTDLNRSLEQALKTRAVRIRETRAQITSDDLPLVWGEERQLAEVFQNLLSNALKYRRSGELPHIHIAARRIDNLWEVSVQDNGMGFAPHYAERIFGLFKRLHKDEYPGTGLGLAICKRIIERYGGHIRASSEGEGRGATIYFTLRAYV